MNVGVVIYWGERNERRFRVSSLLADDLIKLFDERKRFWEWEEDLELLQKIQKAQAAMIDKLQKRLNAKHEKEGV